jgi:putative membrane protein insertion efficiency factor
MIDHVRRFFVSIISLPIRFYQRVISPAFPARCKYYPSCSSYALSALRTYGIARGSVLAIWRILRCNPFSHGGYDPVEAQRIFGRKKRAPRGSTA